MYPKKHLLPLLLLVCLLLTVSTCTKDVFVPVEIPTPVVPDFEELPRSQDPYRRIYNIYKFDDNMVLKGEGIDFLHAPDSTVTGYISRTFSGFRETTSQTLRLRIYGNRFDVVPIGFELFQFSSLNIRLEDIYPDYELPFSFANYRSSLGSLSENNYLLLPFDRASDRRLHFAMAQITPPESIIFPPVLDTLQTFIFDIEGSEYSSRGIEMLPVEGGFLFENNSFATGSTLHRIDYNGNFEEVVPTSVSQLFYFRGIPYAHRYRDGQSQILTADPEGRNWQISWTFPNPLFERVYFYPVGEDLFMYNATGDRMSLATQLDVDGIRLEAVEFSQLESYTVTDIAEYQGDIYIGTLSGFFRRNYEDFKNSREE